MATVNFTDMLQGEDLPTLKALVEAGDWTLINKIIDSITNKNGADHLHFEVRNNTDADIPKGTVVTGSSTQPGTDYIVVEPRTSASQVALGVTHALIAKNGTGLVTNRGISADEVDTDDWDEGTILYPNTSGGFTPTKPTTGVYQACALVTRKHQTQGTLLLDFSNPQPVEDDFVSAVLSDTKDGSLMLNDLLYMQANEGPDSVIYFRDATNANWRSIRWDDSAQEFAIVDNTSTLRTLLHSGNLDISLDASPTLGGALDFGGFTAKGQSVRQIADASLSSGTYTFNYANGDMQQLTATGSITIAFSNMPSSTVSGFIIDAVNWGAYTITHPAGMLFADGTAPSYTASGTDRLLVTRDKDGVYALTVIAQDIKAA